MLRKINGKVNPGDLITKPKSAAEAARLTEAVGYELVIRDRSKAGDETFYMFVNRALRGDRRDPSEVRMTSDWWHENMSERWDMCQKAKPRKGA